MSLFENADNYFFISIYLIIYVITALVCGAVAVHKNRNPVLFVVICLVLGFLFGGIGIFAAFMLPVVSPKKSKLPEEIQGLKYNHKINDAYENDILSYGGWKCKYCGALNLKNTGTCGCGKSKE